MERQKIESQFKWTIDEMYPSESDLNKDIEKVRNRSVQKMNGVLTIKMRMEWKNAVK